MTNYLRHSRKQANRPERAFLAALLALVMSCALMAQQQNPPPKPETPPQKEQEGFKIGVEVNLVTVPVTVRKSSGGFLRGLKQESFVILEDGEEQEILYFAQEGVPTRIALLLDISGSVQSEWGGIKYSTRKFVGHLKPEDQFSLVTFNHEVRLKMDWGNNADRLDAVLGSVYCKGQTNLWDALYLAGTEMFKGVREKKAVIIMSDGLDSGSLVSFPEMLDSLVRSEAMVYVVSKTEAVRNALLYQLQSNSVYGGIPHEAFLQADFALRKIAHDTGGRVLYPNSFGQLDNIYAEVDEELRSQYTLSYISKNKVKDGSYRKIQVGVNVPNAVASARPGYYAANEISTTR